MSTDTAPHFIRDLIAADLAEGKNGGVIHTRFPPEPNGFLHIGHAKAIHLDFGMAAEFGGECNLRFDDTNPVKEETLYVEGIKEDIRWLGYAWDHELYASDWFERLYELAVQLIRKGLAYVDNQSLEQIREGRGMFKRPGVDSPFRTRSVDENLALFEKMRAGDFAEGEAVLRAKIDMSSPNMNLRDPIMYRILKAHHHRTGDAWCIYPMYDWAHGESDALEGITHSLCTLEFENHRPLYEWFVDHLDGLPVRPRQIEMARLNLSYTVLSKRKLLRLVKEELVDGWDDPRMPTLVGMRRRGYSPAAIRQFCDRIGVAKRDGVVDVTLLEHALREDLNETSIRVMGVIDPLEVVIENFPEGHTEWFEAPLHPTRPELGMRRIPLSRRVYVERDDFREVAPRKWRRLSPGAEVRLRYAALITVREVVKDAAGQVVRLICTYDPDAVGGDPTDGRKVQGTLHWVSAEHAVSSQVYLYDRLFTVPAPDAEEADFTTFLNPDSLQVMGGAKLEPYLATVAPETRVQFERLGYFVAEGEGGARFNRTIGLRDSWARVERSEPKPAAPAAPEEKKMTEETVTAEVIEVSAREDREPAKEVITFDDFAKLDLRVGVIREAGPVKGARKLLRLGVDLGEGRLRQVFAGVAKAYPDPSVLLGESVVVVANLAPRQMSFGLSEAMILAGGGGTDRLGMTTLKGTFLPGDTVT
ncbi:MAG: glutamine--tRNA ligase/YqeY domain fusion protein [Deltaproteobacteria bacterium]|nr:glutamine--tRNA ligase/YqeY domain fusion protein [Deltaproteobacteria bacterium]